MNQTMLSSVSAFGIDEQRLGRGQVILAVEGAVDLFAAPELKRRLLEAIDMGAREIILDLSETAFLDSTGLGALLTAHKRLAGRDGRLVVVSGPPSVARVFEITGLDAIFSFAATREQAIEQLALVDL